MKLHKLQVVQIRIQVLDLEKSNNCTYDSLQIWDVIGNKGLLIGEI